MELSAPTFQNTRVSCVPYQRIFESVDGLGYFAAAEYKLGLRKLIESILESFVRHSRNRADELVGELTADYSAHLRHVPDGGQSIQPGHQRSVKSRRNGMGRKRLLEHVFPLLFLKQPDFNHCFRQFFDE